MRVLIADDHAALRQSLAQALESEPNVEVVGEAADGGAAVRLARQLQPDVILMDVVMPQLSGIEATRRIIQECPQVCIIGLSVHDSTTYASRMRQAGARSYLLKDCDMGELVREIQTASGGQ